MDYDQFQELFELICDSLAEQEGRTHLGFKGALECDGPEGIVMAFLFQKTVLAIRFPETKGMKKKKNNPPLEMGEMLDLQDSLRDAKDGFSALFS